MPRYRTAFGRPCLTPAQIGTLLVFDLYRRRVAGRPSRPTLNEISLELNISIAGARAHTAALFFRGMLEDTGTGARYRTLQLSEKGRRWCSQKRKRLARRIVKPKGPPGHPDKVEASSTLSSGKTAEKIALSEGVTERTVRKNADFAEAMDATEVEKLYAAAAKERQRLSEGRGKKGIAPAQHLNGKASYQAAKTANRNSPKETY